MTLPRTVAACKNLPLDDRTIFACSYPKSGTTWLQAMLYELCVHGQRPLDHISTFCPFFENDKSWVFADGAAPAVAPHHAAGHAAIGWRIFNTHLWWEMMPKDGDARYVYVVRSARDVCASFYHHLSHMAVDDGGYEGSLDDFVAEWTAGRLAFGSWPAHLSSWLDPEAPALAASARDPRVLVVSYEGMKADLAAATRAVARHIRVDVTDEELAVILPRLDVGYMRKNIGAFEPKSCNWVEKGDGFQFVRKGEVGGGKALFTDGLHEARFRALFETATVPKCCVPFTER
jgi:hypothetical protein